MTASSAPRLGQTSAARYARYTITSDGSAGVDYALGSVALDNRRREDCASSVRAALPHRGLAGPPWRERIAGIEPKVRDILPPLHSLRCCMATYGPATPRFAGQACRVDRPACYHGHAEVDLAMLTLFDAPPGEFWMLTAPSSRWEDRRDAYQLFPALVHLRLFGSGYAALVDRLLHRLEV
jgi:hypothetical protein